MDNEVVHLADFRRPPAEPPTQLTYGATILVMPSEGGPTCKLVAYWGADDLTPAERLRLYADALDELAAEFRTTADAL